jgi:hypothetical protein
MEVKVFAYMLCLRIKLWYYIKVNGWVWKLIYKVKIKIKDFVNV